MVKRWRETTASCAGDVTGNRFSLNIQDLPHLYTLYIGRTPASAAEADAVHTECALTMLEEAITSLTNLAWVSFENWTM